MLALLRSSIRLFGFWEGTRFYFKTLVWDFKVVSWWNRVTKKSWCEMNGYTCKDKNCEFPHHEKPRPFCDARLDFRGTNNLVWCVKWRDHEGNHQGGGFEWEEGTISAHASDLFRMQNLFELNLKKRFDKIEEKK